MGTEGHSGDLSKNLVSKLGVIKIFGEERQGLCHEVGDVLAVLQRLHDTSLRGDSVTVVLDERLELDSDDNVISLCDSHV